jgi:hypothetical protein
MSCLLMGITYSFDIQSQPGSSFSQVSLDSVFAHSINIVFTHFIYSIFAHFINIVF